MRRTGNLSSNNNWSFSQIMRKKMTKTTNVSYALIAKSPLQLRVRLATL